jgi:hypothetical protein
MRGFGLLALMDEILLMLLVMRDQMGEREHIFISFLAAALRANALFTMGVSQWLLSILQTV